MYIKKCILVSPYSVYLLLIWISSLSPCRFLFFFCRRLLLWMFNVLMLVTKVNECLCLEETVLISSPLAGSVAPLLSGEVITSDRGQPLFIGLLAHFLDFECISLLWLKSLSLSLFLSLSLSHLHPTSAHFILFYYTKFIWFWYNNIESGFGHGAQMRVRVISA